MSERTARLAGPALLALAVACTRAPGRPAPPPDAPRAAAGADSAPAAPAATPATTSAANLPPDAAPPAAAADSAAHERPAAVRRAVADTLRRVLDAAVADSAFPGAFAVVGDRAGVLAQYGAGRLDWGPSPRPDERTLWDMASLTKVVATTSAIMQLVAEGSVDLQAQAKFSLPEWKVARAERVRVIDLLTHSSGLPAWRPLYKEADTPAAALAVVYATALDTLPRVRYVYSDLGAILLGQIVEHETREPLDRYVARRVFGPLGMTDTRFRPPASELARIAPTEYDPWRQRKLRGEVHDENAAALGGVAGHAGLFSTGHDMARFARMYLNRGTLDGVRVLDSITVREFTTRQDSTLSHRALGWETPNGQNSAGHRLSPTAFGHTGFTGTSLWVDPAQDLFVILLTNRVNPTRQNTKIGAVRVALTDAVVAALRPSVPPPTPARR